ncbi:MAG: IS1595 family transposase [Scytolyngbya sp. HA4215-MV1]|jgi:transposase-like protein|nr:IS1595 family transposase [Scytolyngbya sp. HA4215-MV1]
MSEVLTQIRTLQEAVQYFSCPDRCLNYIASKRWENGVAICPHCGCDKTGFISTRRMWKCKNKECRKQFSVKRGTIMEDSPLGLDKWLIAIWLIVNAKNGISSCELARALGITQKSAWFLLHRIRLAMQAGSFELSGEVEADETYVGGKAENMHKDKREEKIKGRGGKGKTIVFGLLERGGKVKAKVIASNDKKTLHKEIKENVSTVTRGSVSDHTTQIYTDGHPGYEGLDLDYLHSIIDHTIEYVNGNISTNGIENFWTLLKRSLKGTYVAVEPEHLFRYVDEQAFRFNNRKGKDGDRFVSVLGGIQGKRIAYKKLIGKKD